MSKKENFRAILIGRAPSTIRFGDLGLKQLISEYSIGRERLKCLLAVFFSDGISGDDDRFSLIAHCVHGGLKHMVSALANFIAGSELRNHLLICG